MFKKFTEIVPCQSNVKYYVLKDVSGINSKIEVISMLVSPEETAYPEKLAKKALLQTSWFCPEHSWQLN